MSVTYLPQRFEFHARGLCQLPPRHLATPTPLASRLLRLYTLNISHKKRSVDSDDQTDQHENLFESHDHSSPAIRQELNHKSRRLYQAYVENVDDSEPEQTSGDSQRSANLGVWPSTDHNDDIYDRDACQESQLSGQTATSLTPHRPDTTKRKPYKRKPNFEDRGASKRAQSELADAAQVGPKNSNSQRSGLFELRSAPDRNDESLMPQPEMIDAGQASRLPGSTVASAAPRRTVAKSRLRSSKCKSPDAVDPPDEENDRLANLPADLHAKVQRIAGAATLKNVWYFFDYMRNPFSPKDAWADQDALERDRESHIATSSDFSLRARLKRKSLLRSREW